MAETAAIDPNELRALDRAIGDLALLSGRSINSVMKQMIPRVARSAAKATAPGGKFPPNPKNRPKRDIRGRLLAKRKRGEVPWWADYQLTVYKQGRGGSGIKRTLYVTEEKLSKFIRIPNRGVAKGAWFGAGAAVSRSLSQGVMNMPKGSRRYSRGRAIKDNGQMIGAVLENRVRYIQKAGADSARIGIQKQTNWLGNALRREEDKIARKFASATRRAVGGLI